MPADRAMRCKWTRSGVGPAGPRNAEVAWLVRLVAPRTTAVLIEGETGTGKEVIPGLLHGEPGGGQAVCGAELRPIPESLLGGAVGTPRGLSPKQCSRAGRGFEAAHGGTLLLDEDREMPLGMQRRCCLYWSRRVQRVATTSDARSTVRLTRRRTAAGTTIGGREVRLALYHRPRCPHPCPSRRERMEDIPALVEHFPGNRWAGASAQAAAAGCADRLNEHLWPGNVRE